PANLCPTFSPAMEAGERPLVPAGRPRPQLAVAAQSGGIGFAFFDHGRAKELSFRYIVTTGNEACLEVLDFADFILDEGKTDALLLLLEDVKSPDTFRRVAEKALSAGKPLIVNKIGQSDAGVRAAASHTAALARLAAETAKPILMWSYTLPVPRSVEILSEAGYPLYTGIQTCARTLRAMADYRALRERFLRPIEVTSAFVPDKAGASAALAAA